MNRALLAVTLGLLALRAAAGFVGSDPAAAPAARRDRLPVATAVPAPLAAPTPGRADSTALSPAFSKPAPTSLADLKAIERQVKALVARLSPAVVAVEVGSGSGSGVIISADGLVLTAGHVCGAPNGDVRFTFPDGKTARGKTLGVNHESDTGLMRITDHGPWPHADVGELAHGRLGDWVLALGHPGGFDRQRSLVVRLGRILRLQDDALQTDCTISPGDSGGPLFDMYGRVIGIHSTISTSLAANYHVPINQFFDTWETLAKAGAPTPEPPRSYVGARGLEDATGYRLTAIDENSPASKAGLKVGDIVLKVDGREIHASAVFQRWVAESRPGETLDLVVQRGNKLIMVRVKVVAPPTKS
jgi:serine protease Do